MDATVLLPQHGRYDYSPIVERKDYSWPGGKRLAFCLTTNITVFGFGKGRGPDNAKLKEPQTQRNFAWREYGSRIGIWRLFDLADELGIPLAHNTTSLLYDYAPQIFARIRAQDAAPHPWCPPHPCASLHSFFDPPSRPCREASGTQGRR